MEISFNSQYQILTLLSLVLLAVIILLFKNKVATFFRLAAKFFPNSKIRIFFLRCGGVEIGSGVFIGSNNFFGRNVSIGDNVQIGSNNLISNSKISDGCVLTQEIIMSHVNLDSGVHIHRGVKFYCERGVKVGKDSNILQYCCFEGKSEVSIGAFSEISSFCNFYTVSSMKRALTKNSRSLQEDQKLESSPIHLGNNVWFGPLVTVYPGVSVGSHCGVLSNSVVTKDINDFKLAGGVPAEIKRNITIDDSNVSLNRL
tara:strand:- start:701 stop:1471 length:771 start_codon:yes stop_codon:yes gene_type:complete